MPDYHFVTEWDIPAPIDEVFRLIADSLRWPEWWRGVRSVRELAPGDANGIGVIRRYEWRSQLPCSLVFDMRLTVVEPPHDSAVSPPVSSPARAAGTSPAQPRARTSATSGTSTPRSGG